MPWMALEAENGWRQKSIGWENFGLENGMPEDSECWMLRWMVVMNQFFGGR
jgi:hypothetical protein